MALGRNEYSLPLSPPMVAEPQTVPEPTRLLSLETSASSTWDLGVAATIRSGSMAHVGHGRTFRPCEAGSRGSIWPRQLSPSAVL